MQRNLEEERQTQRGVNGGVRDSYSARYRRQRKILAREKSRNKLRQRKAESEQWRTPYQEIQRHTKIESEWEENRPERREIETGKQRHAQRMVVGGEVEHELLVKD